MWGALDRFGQVLVDATLAMTVFMSLVVLLVLSCRQPAMRLAIARGAVLIAIVMIPLAAASPLPRISPFFWIASDPDRPIADRAAEAVGAGAGETGPLAASSALAEDHSPRLPRPAGDWKESWPLRACAIAYLTGALVGVVWLMIGYWGMRRLVRESVEPGPALRALYADLIKEVGGANSAPDLRVSSRIHRPVLAGLTRTTIVIPQALQEPEFDQGFLRLVLVHELAHADQGDTITGAAASLAQCFWFFLPFLWWLRSQLRIDQEFLADQRTAIMAGSSAAYATRLVSLSTPYEGSPATRPIIEAVPMLRGWWWDGGFKSPLLQRVVMLLHCPYQIETEPLHGWAWLVSVCVVGLGILCSSLSLSTSARASTWNRASGETPPGAANTFQVAQFVAAPRGTNSSGRSVPYVLPLVLPPRFEMAVEIQAPAQGLRQTRLAGLLLDVQPVPTPASTGEARTPGEANTPGELAEAWHRVRLSRSAASITLTLDGALVPYSRRGESLSEWLTVEPPPDQTVVLRNLVITW
jgi:beta-lactamase regulating signal transducer with metallopeptidase domain